MLIQIQIKINKIKQIIIKINQINKTNKKKENIKLNIKLNNRLIRKSQKNYSNKENNK